MPLTSHKTAAALLTVTLAASLASCTGDAAAPAPSSSPPVTPFTPAPSPSSATPSPTPSLDERQQLVKEAIDQYTKIEQAHFEITKAGGLKPGEPVPKTFSEMVTGAPLRAYVNVQHQVHDKEIVWQSGELLISQGREEQLRPVDGALVTINICSDGSAIENLTGPEKKPSRGQPMRSIAGFKRESGRLVLFASKDAKDPTCVA